MPLFRHRISGPGSAGDTWTTGLYTESAATIQDAHQAWYDFCFDVIDGTLKALWKTTTAASQVTTDALNLDGHHATDQRSGALALSGTGTGGGTSPRACLVVGLKTSVPQRSGRGRMFWPGLDGSHYTAAGLFVPATIATIADAFNVAFVTLQNVSQPVIYHRGPEDVPWTADNIVQVKVGNIPGTQRRRTNKVANTYETRII